MPKKLSSEELEVLRNWLSFYEVQANMNKLHRDFSDAVLMAILLKKFHPKLVDLHNYPSRSSLQLKQINWETLNHKVFVKIGLQQSKPTIEKLVKSTPGVIERLLLDLMELEDLNRKERNNHPNENEQWSEIEDVMIISVNKQVGDAIVQIPQKMIMYSIYEQTLNESQTKDAYIAAADQKIAHLENILRLKGQRIDELSAQLSRVTADKYYGVSQISRFSSHSLANPIDTLQGNHLSRRLEV